MIVLGIIVGLLVLSFLVALHELGHAYVAHKNGVVVEEYAIGFPPNVWAKKLRSGIVFKVNALPIGGYVKLKGEYDAAKGKGDYGAASYFSKTKILFAGVAMNFLIAVVILTVLAATGLPKVLQNQVVLKGDAVIDTPVTVAGVEKDGPAAVAGLKQGDEVLMFAGMVVDSPAKLTELTAEYAGQTVPIVIRRSSQEQTVELTVRGTDKPADKGFIGLYPTQQSFIKTKWYRAPVLAVSTTAQLSWETLKSVGQLFVDFFSGLVQKISFDPAVRQQGSQNLARAGDSVAGPIALLGLIFPSLLKSDLTTFWFFVALISLTLTVMNLLPIPGLDGGRWTIMTIFRLMKQKLTKEREEKIQSVGVMVLLGIMILVVISDVFKIV